MTLDLCGYCRISGHEVSHLLDLILILRFYDCLAGIEFDLQRDADLLRQWAAILVNRRSFRCVRTLVEIIRDAVAVTVERASVRINLYAFRCIRTLVE